MEKYKKVVDAVEHQKEIENTRKGGFGGSDARMFLRIAEKGGVDKLSQTDKYRISVAMGLSEYKSIPMTSAMKKGHEFEDWFCENQSEILDIDSELKAEYKMQKPVTEGDNFEVFAHADFVYDQEGKLTVYELKCSKKEFEEVRTTYSAQLQWYYMLGATRVFLVHSKDGESVDSVSQIMPNKDTISQLEEGIRVLNEAWSDGWTPEILMELTEDDMSEGIQEILKDIIEATRQKESYEAIIEEKKAELDEYMTLCGAKSIKTSDVNVTLIPSSVTKTFDSKAFKEANPDMYNQYIKESEKKGFMKVLIKK